MTHVRRRSVLAECLSGPQNTECPKLGTNDTPAAHRCGEWRGVGDSLSTFRAGIINLSHSRSGGAVARYQPVRSARAGQSSGHAGPARRDRGARRETRLRMETQHGLGVAGGQPMVSAGSASLDDTSTYPRTCRYPGVVTWFCVDATPSTQIETPRHKSHVAIEYRDHAHAHEPTRRAARRPRRRDHRGPRRRRRRTRPAAGRRSRRRVGRGDRHRSRAAGSGRRVTAGLPRTKPPPRPPPALLHPLHRPRINMTHTAEETQ